MAKRNRCRVFSWVSWLLALSACGSPEDTAPMTHHGVRVIMSRSQEQWIELSDIAVVIDRTADHFARIRGHDRTQLDVLLHNAGLVVELQMHPIRGGEGGDPAYGTYTAPNQIRVVATRDRPLCASSLTHEMVHFLAHHTEGDSDTHHDDRGLFKADESVTLSTLRACEF